MPKISLIAAMSENRAIGKNNALPWTDPIAADWENLEKVTQGKKMIMGRKSYDNPHRVWSEAGNYVVTRQQNYQVDQGFEVAYSLQEALSMCEDQAEVYVIGGQEIFEQALPLADKIVLTIVHQEFSGDTFFPVFEHLNFQETKKKAFKIGGNSPYPMSIITYERVKN